MQANLQSTYNDTSTLLILLVTSPHQHIILATAKKASENICVFQSSLYE